MTTVTLSMNDQSIRLSLDDLENALLAAKRKPGQKVLSDHLQWPDDHLAQRQSEQEKPAPPNRACD